MQMFSPFIGQQAETPAKKTDAKDIEELKEQLRTLQDRLNSL